MTRTQVLDTNTVENSSFIRKKIIKKTHFSGTDDLEIWPFNGPPHGQKRTWEVKSISTDPGRARTKPLEPSSGRFCRTSDQKPGSPDRFAAPTGSPARGLDLHAPKRHTPQGHRGRVTSLKSLESHQIVFASRIPSRPLRLGGLGSGAWRLGDLGALFLLLGRLPRSYLHLAWMTLKCSTVVNFWPGWP